MELDPKNFKFFKFLPAGPVHYVWMNPESAKQSNKPAPMISDGVTSKIWSQISRYGDGRGQPCFVVWLTQVFSMIASGAKSD